jgi:hypothetical protein
MVSENLAETAGNAYRFLVAMSLENIGHEMREQAEQRPCRTWINILFHDEI